jgi:hypothetical protein
VIILALGLLGLGVVFPVVVREQKIAQDRISGTVADNNVRAVMGGLDRLNRPSDYYLAADAGGNLTGALVGRFIGWEALKEEWKYVSVVNRTLAGTLPLRLDGGIDFANQFTYSPEGLWETFWGYNLQAPSADAEYGQLGNIVLVDRDNIESAQQEDFPASVVAGARAELDRRGFNTLPITFQREFLEFRLPLSQRINPAGDPTSQTPTLVWDVVVRRRMETADPRALQVAVFIRRVDPRLRPIPRTPPRPGDTEIPVSEQIFSPNLSVAQRRLPVGEDNTGLPTLDGTNGSGGVQYSGVHTVGAYFYADPNDPFLRKRDRIWVVGGFGNDVALVSQLGQRVIDNLGNV